MAIEPEVKTYWVPSGLRQYKALRKALELLNDPFWRAELAGYPDFRAQLDQILKEGLGEDDGDASRTT